jgi:hypothetical protein
MYYLDIFDKDVLSAWGERIRTSSLESKSTNQQTKNY